MRFVGSPLPTLLDWITPCEPAMIKFPPQQAGNLSKADFQTVSDDVIISSKTEKMQTLKHQLSRANSGLFLDLCSVIVYLNADSGCRL